MRALALGMALAVTGSAALAIASITGGDVELWTQARGWSIKVALLLMAAGMLMVETTGWRRHAMRGVAVLLIGWLAWLIVRPHVELSEASYRVIAATLWWSGIVLLTIAARAWWRPATKLVAIAAIAAVVLEALPWAPYLAPAFDEALAGHAIAEELSRPVRELVTSAAILVLVHGIESS